MKMDYTRHGTARMFDNGFLEACSKVHPAAPFVFYVPLISWLQLWGLTTARTTVFASLVFIPLGWVTWCLLEYVIHRSFFHWEGTGPFTRKVHEIAHGYHHKYPDDHLRLVMPLGASIPMAIGIGGVLYLVQRPLVTIPYFVGIVAGYLLYDFIHWSTHARTPLTVWGKTMRSHHMAHHFAVTDQNFGISHRWVDRILGTLKRR